LYRNALLLTRAHSRSWARAARPPPDCTYFTPLASSAAEGGRLSDDRYNSETTSASGLPLRTALATRPLASATASEMVLPFTRFNACGRVGSARRLRCRH